jgi:undecaprenyl-diphosphatase
MLGELDAAFMLELNKFARKSVFFDFLIVGVFRLDTIKMMPLVGAIFYVWFAVAERRRAVFDGLLGAFIALVVSRLIQNVSDHRPRPALSGQFEFTLPVGGYTNDWSSFPSDNAALGFALATTLWLASRPIGAMGFAWAIIIICFPRLYGGFHYPSDVLAGAAIGVFTVLAVAKCRPLFDAPFKWLMRLESRRAGLFYLFAFFFAFQLTTFFADVRKLGSIARDIQGTTDPSSSAANGE